MATKSYQYNWNSFLLYSLESFDFNYQRYSLLSREQIFSLFLYIICISHLSWCSRSVTLVLSWVVM